MKFEEVEVSDVVERIKEVKEVYECGHQQVLITLKNDYKISCIKGFGTYSDESRCFCAAWWFLFPS